MQKDAAAVQVLPGYQQRRGCYQQDKLVCGGSTHPLQLRLCRAAPGRSDRPFSLLHRQQMENSSPAGLVCSKHPLPTLQLMGLAGGWVHLGSRCARADGRVGAAKPWEEAGALHQIPSLTRSDRAERVSDREGGRQDGSDGGAGGGERETGP